MWKYVKRYLPCAVFAALFMMGEVLMDLIQPGLMRTIVDDGVLGVNKAAGTMSRCGDMLARLPQSYDTVLTGAGGSISQGQR